MYRSTLIWGMKCLLFIILLQMQVKAQDWFLVESGVTSNLYDIQFVDRNTGWAVGEDSTIIKTTDGGHTWFRQTGGVAAQYRCLFFVDENNGWIGCEDGYVLKTNNGGDTWDTMRVLDVKSINGISFVDANTGWMATTAIPDNFSVERGHILKTTDGGSSWKAVLTTPIRVPDHDDSTFRGIYHDVDFLDTQVGCACGEISYDVSRNLGSVICTSDGGATWEHVTDWTRWVATYRIAMVAADTLYAATSVGVGRTLNRGATYWDPFKPYSSVFDIAVHEGNCVFALGQFASEISIRQYVHGSDDAIFQRLEGTPNFVDQNNRGLFMGLFMFDTSSGWICGDNGQLWSKPAIGVNVGNIRKPTPTGIQIHTIYPNPFSVCQSTQEVSIEYTISQVSTISLEIYNSVGVRIRTIHVTDNALAGLNSLRVSLGIVRKGVYFCRLVGYSNRYAVPLTSTVQPLLIR